MTLPGYPAYAQAHKRLIPGFGRWPVQLILTGTGYVGRAILRQVALQRGG